MDEHQKFEQAWWGDCLNTYGEETKQRAYAPRMGLDLIVDQRTGQWPWIDLGGRTVVDLGGGPVSLLLKAINRGAGCTIVDPCPYPEWTVARYGYADIRVEPIPAEVFERDDEFDEAWIYNCLQHVEDPAKIVENARRAAGIVRIFEWIETPPTLGHPHTLTADRLDTWLGEEAADGGCRVEYVNEHGAVGLAYFGMVAT